MRTAVASLGPVRRTLLLFALAAGLAGCGSSDSGLLKDNEAELLTTVVDDVERALGEEDCARARREALDGANLVSELRRTVNRKLKRNLREWFEHVADRVEQDCEPEEPEETPTPDPTSTPTATATPTATPTATATPSPTATASPTITPVPEGGDGNGGAEGPGDSGDGG